MNDELLNNFFLTNNLSAGTIKHYKTALRQYCEFNKKDLRELLMEAEEDEKNNVKWKYSKLKARLLKYRQHLLNIYSLGTVKGKMLKIIKFYKFYDIDVEKLPKINEKSVIKTKPIYFKDLPDKEI